MSSPTLEPVAVVLGRVRILRDGLDRMLEGTRVKREELTRHIEGALVADIDRSLEDVQGHLRDAIADVARLATQLEDELLEADACRT